MKLVIQLALFNQAIALQIREQSADIGRTSSETNVIARVEHNGGLFHLRISFTPEINASSLYIRGSSSNSKYDICPRTFTSKKFQNDYVEKIVAVLGEFSQLNGLEFNVADFGHTQIITCYGETP